MDAEARKQRAGDTVDPLRHPLIAAAHPRQGEQAGNHQNRASVSMIISRKMPQRAPAPTLSPTNSENTEPK